MEYNPNVRLDTSEVEDARGQSGTFGGLPGGALTAGGGGLGILGVIIFVLINVLGGGSGTSSIGGLGSLANTSTYGQASSSLTKDCQTGADANTKQECRIVADVDSVQKYWSDVFTQMGRTYTPAPTEFFSNQTQTGCGPATTDVGPFYCPVDKTVYIDLGFFQELQTKFGAQGGVFAQSYVIAHEYGHHIQDLLGTLAAKNSGSQQGADSTSVRIELQADCFAGVWAHNAVATGYVLQLTPADLSDGLNAAAAVGDDRIQQASQGQVNPETWTHGSSAQREQWLTTGYQSGNMNACDTFSGNP
jgi:predicted metalloprotease